MENSLTDVEIRVLGSLMEKEMATPEHYPLSLNALTNACNQKSNRDPVFSCDEETVMEAVTSLKGKKFVWQSDAGRVAKYSQNFVKLKDLTSGEAALVCLLLLRGPQTLGELRGRSERLHRFESLEEVEEVLESLAGMDLTVKLPKQPGRKEARYTHLLGGMPDMTEGHRPEQKPGPEPASPSTGQGRMDKLEEEVFLLRQELNDLRAELREFKKLFE